MAFPSISATGLVPYLDIQPRKHINFPQDEGILEIGVLAVTAEDSLVSLVRVDVDGDDGTP